MNLFENSQGSSHHPLAYRMRPRTLDEYVGQDHIVGQGRLLRRAIQADQLSSIILYGPPGTGKTTLARVIANTTESHFSTINAVLSGVKELRYEIEEASRRLSLYSKRTILFIDEVHRWNKSQQDALLPWVENGTFILIGATTENPYFEVNSALVSRSRIFQLTSLTSDDLLKIAEATLKDKERGYGQWRVSFEKGALEHIVDIANGDARSLLNALELAVETSPEKFPPPPGEKIFITQEAAEESIQRKVVLYDKEGDYHFDVISAFIKSIRGSDSDATLYWLAKMVRSGEDPKYIFRRMLISAAEDIGLADPNAINVVASSATAFDRVGLPEGSFHLTLAALYLASAPKSNSTLAFYDALKAIEEESASEVPNHLKDASRDKKGFGHGEGYLYPHAYQNHWVAQQYLPTPLQGKVFYNPTEMGYEGKIREEVIERREAQLEVSAEDPFVGNLTYSPDDNLRDMWVERSSRDLSSFLILLKNSLYSKIKIERHSKVAVLNGGHGLLVWEALRRAPEGLVVATTTNQEHFHHMEHYSQTLPSLERPQVRLLKEDSYTKELKELIPFEAVIGRNLFSRLDESKELAQELYQLLKGGGVLALAEVIPSAGSRLSHLIKDGEIKESLQYGEKLLYSKEGPSLTNWETQDLTALLEANNFEVELSTMQGAEERLFTKELLTSWITNSYQPIWGDKIDSKKVITSLVATLANKRLPWHQVVAIVTARKRSSY
ncbi:MAG: AAA family ATPase [Sphaerochaetaceae bacterium]|jgi:putative ATPase|nr:AAA family ATPase [Sphaerochaetaceae bacterium]HHU88582.1 AAA family ATPase [Spirochaetales bacterium]